MVAPLLVGGIAGAIVAVIISLIAYRIYRRTLVNTLIQQQGWENAQEKRQQDWEHQQEKHATALEERLTIEVQQVQHEWDAWEQKDIARVQTLEQQYEFATAQTSLEQTLEHLPLVEEASLPETENQSRRDAAAKARAAQLAGEDLSGRNLSRRYLSHANLRGASLTNANLFMADLSYASLVGADLTHADLSGANLVGADLSNALLTNANLLVADVNNANFAGADISKARNLVVAQQVEDETTGDVSVDDEFDEDEDVTQTRLPIIPKSVIISPPTISQPSVEEPVTDDPTSKQFMAEEVTVGNYDIIRAQSLEVIPEPEATTESTQQPSILSFPGLLPETPFSVNEEWVPSLSDEALHMLEGVHFPSNTQHSTDDFDATDSHETYNGRRHVRAS